jgi:hypothetical protein
MAEPRSTLAISETPMGQARTGSRTARAMYPSDR